MVHNFEAARLCVLPGLLDRLFNGLLHAVNGLRNGARDFHLFGDFFIEVIDAGQVGEEVESQFRIIAETPVSPAIPFVTSIATPPAIVDLLRTALLAVGNEPRYAAAREGDKATLQAYVFPLVTWIWVGAMVLIGGTLVVMFLYLGANLAYHLVLDPREMAGMTDTSVATGFSVRLLGPIGGVIMSVAVMFSTFGALNGNLLVGPRLLYAMGEDGLAPRALGAVHPGYRTPALAILVFAVWSSLLVGAVGAVGWLTCIVARRSKESCYGSKSRASRAGRGPSTPVPHVPETSALTGCRPPRRFPRPSCRPRSRTSPSGPPARPSS